MITLTASTLAVGPGVNAFFLGSGGTGPYTYSVDPGGAGGSIDVNGKYTAGSGCGLDVVRVTDSLAATTTLTILVGDPIQLVCNIIKTELGLSADQVHIWDQKFKMPNDSRLYVVVRSLHTKFFGNSRVFDGDGNVIQGLNICDTLSIDVQCRKYEPARRRFEVLMALNSQYAETQQEVNCLRLGTLPLGFVDLSELDGAAIPYRYNLTVNLQYVQKKTSAVPYFDDFDPTEVVEEA